MTDILTVEQVAEMLGCTPETVREKTPAIIPGAKFGRDWVYSRGLVIEAVEREATEANRRALSPRRPELWDFVSKSEITKGSPPSLQP